MAYTIVGCAILFGTALLTSFLDWEIEQSFQHAFMVWYATGVFMIGGADWVLQRTEWGRKRSPNPVPSDLD